ncbi:MAG: NAD(P)(+) transhydrogenase (Re/Si-specific) subunit beta [Phycisphaerales bacterium]
MPEDGATLQVIRDLSYLVAAILFILGIKRLRSPKTARAGNAMASAGMLVAVVATFAVRDPQMLVLAFAGVLVGSAIGAVLAVRVQMTQMPQWVALFNVFGGAASALGAGGVWLREHAAGGEAFSGQGLVAMGVSALIGCVTFTGSLVAAGKLNGTISGKPVKIPAQAVATAGLLAAGVAGVVWLTVGGGPWPALALIAGAALVLGLAITLPIGGADMPVMVSLLNSYSGLAAAAAGFTIQNKALIVAGALVGASGLILTFIMCKAMNRSVRNVMFAGVGTADSAGTAGQTSDTGVVKSAGPEDVAIMLDGARAVMVVPGYGLAVAQAQHAVRDMARTLEEKGVEVLYAMHPVAGRMPGHMNVLLAEADVPYEQLLELEDANAALSRCDVALVIGANDVVNPAARHATDSPIYGMPIVDVDKAQTVFVLKRSMAAGYAGVENELFVADNTLMVFGDAKKTVEAINSAVHEL